jgi:transposase
MIHVGIDLHFTNMVNSAQNDNGDVLVEQTLPATEQSLERFFAQFEQPVQAVVECTGFWYWVADWCQNNEIPLILAHAKMLKAISYAKVKTDKVDARTMADLLRAGLIPRAHMQMGPQRDLRELTRARLRMVQRRERLQSSLWNVAAKYNVNIHDFDSGLRYPGKLGEWLKPQLPPVSYLEAELLLEQLLSLQQHIGRLEQAIEQQATFTPALERILPIPGIGLVTGWSILAEVGQIQRFPTDKKFVSYCRLAPGSNDSGGSRRHKSGNKDGNKYLRLAFGQAAVNACRHYAPVRAYYHKIKRRSGKNIARTVVAKELAKIVWHILTTDEDYKGFKGHPTRIATEHSWPQPISLRFGQER